MTDKAIKFNLNRFALSGFVAAENWFGLATKREQTLNSTVFFINSCSEAKSCIIKFGSRLLPKILYIEQHMV
jgi:hypothetical protein